MAGRNDARRCVLQMLYLVDQNPDADIHWIRSSMEAELGEDDIFGFGWSLFTGIREQQNELNDRISAAASNWRVDRMAPTDRNVLRLGLFEMEHVGTPAAVVLNECIELAREFGTESSPSFVNGILDKLAPTQNDGTSSGNQPVVG